MIRKLFRSAFIGSAAVAVLLSTGCSKQRTSAAEPATPAPVAIQVTTDQSQTIDRFLRVTGSLAADEQAEVAAEAGGRVIATPVERGTRVSAGAVLIRVSGEEANASLREAEANAAQIEARLGLAPGQPFDPARVPEVLNAKASLDWAEAEALRLLVGGDEVTTYNEGGEQYEVHVRALQTERDSAGSIGQLTVPSSRIGSVPLENIADLTRGTASSAIDRLNRQRQVTVFAGLQPGVSQTPAMDAMTRTAEALNMGPATVRASPDVRAS